MADELSQPAPGEVPEGFSRMPTVGGFSDRIGTVYLRAGEHGKDVGAWITEEQCNPNGVAHGGWLMALMDHVLAGASVSHVDQEGQLQRGGVIRMRRGCSSFMEKVLYRMLSWTFCTVRIWQ